MKWVWWAFLSVAAAILLLSPHRVVSQNGMRWYEDDIYDEIASGPAD